jgi:serine/threonine-protein kinase
MNSKKFKLILGLVCFFISYSRLIAAPSEINYQGVLTDQQGNPVNGVRAMQIKLYDAPTGGNMTYQETIGNVTVADGIYSFKFGASGNGVASALNGNDHLALVVDSVEQPTRTKILAVPYALKAKESETSADVDYIKQTLIRLGVLPLFEPSIIVTTLAGSGSGFFTDGYGTGADFSDTAQGVTVDGSGNVYVADGNNHRIRKIDVGGNVTTLAGSGWTSFANGSGAAATFNYPTGVAVDKSGNVYVADSRNHRIRKIDQGGNVTTLAGSSYNGFLDGHAYENWQNAARFWNPTGVAVDESGNVYVADSYNHRIRKIDVGGNVTTLAGSGTQGPSNGQGIEASFNYPTGVAVDKSGNVYVADSSNHRICKIDPGGNVTTLAGSGISGFADGQGTSAKFFIPRGIALDASRNVYVADSGNNRIRKIDVGGNVTTLAGWGSAGFLDAPGTTAWFHSPAGVAVDGSGNVYVADTQNRRIRKITTSGN